MSLCDSCVPVNGAESLFIQFKKKNVNSITFCSYNAVFMFVNSSFSLGLFRYDDFSCGFQVVSMFVQRYVENLVLFRVARTCEPMFFCSHLVHLVHLI